MHEQVYIRLCRAREFINDCYAAPLALENISREAYLSPYHFLRLFRNAFGQTPHQYLTQRRIEKAKYLLSYTSRPITEICFDVGFQSLGSFSTLFHRCTGSSPTEFRARTTMTIQIPYTYPDLIVPACFLLKFAPRPSTKQAAQSL